MLQTNEKIVAIVGITEAIKQYGVPTQFSPTIAIIVGALLEYSQNPTSQGILEGVVMGATVTGGYALTKGAGQGIMESFSKKPDYSGLEADDDRGV